MKEIIRSRFCFVVPDMEAGGAERVLVSFSRMLKEKGESVSFLSLGGDKGELRGWIENEGIAIYSLGYKHVLFSYCSLVKTLKQSCSDTIFVSSRDHVSLVLLFAKIIAKRKVIIRVPTMPSNKLYNGINGFKDKVIAKLNNFTLKRANKIITQTDEMKLALLSKYKGLRSEQVFTLNNPVDIAFITRQAHLLPNPFSNNEVEFLTVGNVNIAKATDVLLEAFQIVRNQIPKAHLYILGRTTSSFAKPLLEKYSSDKTISFLGFIENPYPYIQNCNVFVLSSRMEGFPNVLLEAISLNKPVASTKCVEIVSQLIDEGKNGYTCEVDNQVQLAEAMVKASKLSNIQNHYQGTDKEMFNRVFC